MSRGFAYSGNNKLSRSIKGLNPDKMFPNKISIAQALRVLKPSITSTDVLRLIEDNGVSMNAYSYYFNDKHNHASVVLFKDRSWPQRYLSLKIAEMLLKDEYLTIESVCMEMFNIPEEPKETQVTKTKLIKKAG